MTPIDTTEADLNQTNIGEHEERTAPRRDRILLLFLALLTMGVITGGLELLAGRVFSKIDGSGKCLQLTDSAVGLHGKPNAVCSGKGRETPLIQYKLNSCGHRMDVECGPPKSGTYRIVVMGSSIALGQGVPREGSLAALLPGELSRQTGLEVDVYNEAMWFEYPQVAAMRFNEVLAAKPNMVLWILSPVEIGYETLDPALLNPRPSKKGPLTVRAWHLLQDAAAAARTAPTPAEAWQNVQEKFAGSSVGVMLQHYLYQSQAQYVDSYLRGPDSTTGFLRAEPSVVWSNGLKNFNKDLEKIEKEAEKASIPVAVALIPNRAEAAMISMGNWPSGFDPYKLGDELRCIIESKGARYVDILPEFRSIPNPERYYVPVDGHPDADGHALLSRLLAKHLTSGAFPHLNPELQAHSGVGRGRQE